MPVAYEAIEEHGEPCTLILRGNQRVAEVPQHFIESGYEEGPTWVVVALADGQYGVIRLMLLGGILSEIGPAALDLALADLPIPLAAVVPQDTPRSTGEILDEIEDNAGTIIVITDDEGFVGLLANPTMGGEGGLVNAQSYMELHGEYAKIKDNQVSDRYPTCEHCGYNESRYAYDRKKKTLFCKQCGAVAKVL